MNGTEEPDEGDRCVGKDRQPVVWFEVEDFLRYFDHFRNPTGLQRDRPISPGSPWQNAYMERLIGTLRRECLDQMLIFGETHLRQILTLYASYYNESRTHLSLHKDAPLGRAVQRYGTIAATPVLSGLHHRYARI
jgi:hypothetical protein